MMTMMMMIMMMMMNRDHLTHYEETIGQYREHPIDHLVRGMLVQYTNYCSVISTVIFFSIDMDRFDLYKES